MSTPSRKVRIHLSLPRTGTHFLWSRLIASGRYQLIYDADRVAALAVLREAYDKPLDFLYPAPLNPNYNFQYNSLPAAPGPLNADQHLALLARKYRCSAEPEALFHCIMAHQDNGNRTLFSINRFVYTVRFSHPFRGFVYPISMATKALTLFESWLARGPYEHRTTIMVRGVGEWVKSQIQMQGYRGRRFLRERLEDFPQIMRACLQLGIPIYDMHAVIAAVSRGELEFDETIDALSQSDVERMCSETTAALRNLPDRLVIASVFRPGRFWAYLAETDPVKRLSLVRSIGWLPVYAAPLLPGLGKIIRQDYEGTALDNGRIDLQP